MTEIYWITRLDAVKEGCASFTFLGLIALIIYIILRLVSSNPYFDNHWKGIYDLGMRICRNFALGLLITVPGLLFVPSTKEALLIYGVGNTVDYLASNPTVRNLPDKAVQALSKFADEYINDENKESSEKKASEADEPLHSDTECRPPQQGQTSSEHSRSMERNT